MNMFVTVGLCVALAACVSDHTELRNDKGQVVNCDAEGWGWLGAPMAASAHSNCIKKADAAGFHQAGIASTATPPSPPAPANATPPPTPTAAVAPLAVPTQAIAAPSTTAVSATAAERLKKLDELHKAGLLTQDEYDKKRQEVLATL